MKAEALPLQFKRFDKNNATGRGVNSSAPTVGMAKTGNFRFNAALVELLQLRSGSALTFLYDETEEEWYLTRDDKDGIVLRDAKDGALQFNSATLAVQIGKATEEPSGRMLVAREPKKVAGLVLYTLLTSSMQNTRKRK